MNASRVLWTSSFFTRTLTFFLHDVMGILEPTCPQQGAADSEIDVPNAEKPQPSRVLSDVLSRWECNQLKRMLRLLPGFLSFSYFIFPVHSTSCFPIFYMHTKWHALWTVDQSVIFNFMCLFYPDMLERGRRWIVIEFWWTVSFICLFVCFYSIALVLSWDLLCIFVIILPFVLIRLKLYFISPCYNFAVWFDLFEVIFDFFYTVTDL